MSPSLTIAATTTDEATLLAALDRVAGAHVALATRITGNAEDGREVVQEAWFRAWRHRGSLHADGALEGWLRAILVRECYRHLTRRALRRWLPFGEKVPDLADPRPTPERAVADADTIRRLRHYVEALPPRQRLAWGLRFDEGWTVPEIAAATDTSPDTVKTHLERALATLQRRLGGTHVL